MKCLAEIGLWLTIYVLWGFWNSFPYWNNHPVGKRISFSKELNLHREVWIHKSDSLCSGRKQTIFFIFVFFAKTILFKNDRAVDCWIRSGIQKTFTLIFLKVEGNISSRSAGNMALSCVGAFAMLRCFTGPPPPPQKEKKSLRHRGSEMLRLLWKNSRLTLPFSPAPSHDTHVSCSFIQILVCHRSSGLRQQTERGISPASALWRKACRLRRPYETYKIKLFDNQSHSTSSFLPCIWSVIWC